MELGRPGLLGLTARTIVTHTTNYVLMGLLAVSVLDYEDRFARPEMARWIRPLDDPMVMAGPLFQPLRGLAFALAFYPLRGVIFGRRHGWLILWWTLVALGILSTFGPSPGSIEGLVYTRSPVADQLLGLLEVIPQALLLSVVLTYWVNHPEKRWLNWAMGVTFVLVLALPTLGLLMGGRAGP